MYIYIGGECLLEPALLRPLAAYHHQAAAVPLWRPAARRGALTRLARIGDWTQSYFTQYTGLWTTDEVSEVSRAGDVAGI